MPFQLEDGSGFVVIESTGEIWLENDVASSGIKWPRCCCQAPTTDCGNCCQQCTPIAIPKADLSVSWVGGPGPGCESIPTGGFPDGSGIMVYLPDGYSPTALDGIEFA